MSGSALFLYLFLDFVLRLGEILIRDEESSFPLTHCALEHLSFPATHTAFESLSLPMTHSALEESKGRFDSWKFLDDG
jgi:hypothetical protein